MLPAGGDCCNGWFDSDVVEGTWAVVTTFRSIQIS